MPTARMARTAAIAVFARNPDPGRAKTRLIPLLGREGTAGFQEALIEDTLAKVGALPSRVARYLFLAGGKLSPGYVPPSFRRRAQRGRDLGERLETAFSELLRRHQHAVVIGVDSPLAPPSLLRLALGELDFNDAVVGPCPDGGYYMIGLQRLAPGLFRGVRWGSRYAFRDTLENILGRGLTCSMLQPCSDVDRPEDFARLKRELEKNPAARRLAPAAWQFCKAWRAPGERGLSSLSQRRSSRRREPHRRRRKRRLGRG